TRSYGDWSSDVCSSDLAIRTGSRFGVKPTIAWVAIFAFAIRTHRKALHRSIFAIVRQGFDYGKPRPAIGAVSKWVKVTPVPWIRSEERRVGKEGRVGRS